MHSAGYPLTTSVRQNTSTPATGEPGRAVRGGGPPGPGRGGADPRGRQQGGGGVVRVPRHPHPGPTRGGGAGGGTRVGLGSRAGARAGAIAAPCLHPAHHPRLCSSHGISRATPESPSRRPLGGGRGRAPEARGFAARLRRRRDRRQNSRRARLARAGDSPREPLLLFVHSLTHPTRRFSDPPTCFCGCGTARRPRTQPPTRPSDTF